MNSRVTHLRRLLVLLVLAAVAAVPATASAGTFPDTIRLPDGWQPEGIASRPGHLPVRRVDPDRGRLEGRREDRPGRRAGPWPDGQRSAIGIKVDKRNRLFVAGGATGKAFVYDARTGADLASYQLAAPGAATFVNDVAVTGRKAWFTDSRAAQLYALPLGRHGGLPGQDEVRTLPLTGDFQLQEGNNLNGIVAARDGRVLLAVQTNTGKLFRINPRTGATREVDLGGASLANGDGLLLAGRVLFVVQNRLNQIAVVALSRSLDSGRVVTTLTDPDLDVPTTIAFQAGRLYAVNARFGTTDPQPARYDIVRVG